MERGVKEAQTVSKTGRQDAQRSTYAIIRSANVHCDDIDKETGAKERISHLIDNVEAAVARKQAMIKSIGEDVYAKEHKEAKALLTTEHQRKERIAGVIDSVMETAEKNKASNVRQKATGVTFTPANFGVFEYKHLVKASHAALVEEELRYRGFTDWNYGDDHAKAGKKLLWTDLKNELKAMEKQWVQQQFPGDSLKAAGAEAGFKAQKPGLVFVRVEKAAAK